MSPAKLIPAGSSEIGYTAAANAIKAFWSWSPYVTKDPKHARTVVQRW